MRETKKKTHEQGQVMLLTVLAIGGTVLSATTIAGLLMLYNIRQSGDLTSSAKAIFAADTGIEWGLYHFFCAGTPPKSPCPLASPRLSNGATSTIQCIDSIGGSVACTNQVSVTAIRSVGRAGNVSRAFNLSF